MAYDEFLADRVREMLEGEQVLTEKKMFGGLAFLLGGHMAVAVSGQGGIMVRVDPTRTEGLLARTDARPMEMQGREVRGWVRVETDDIRTRRQLKKWVRLGVTYAASLPPKQ